MQFFDNEITKFVMWKNVLLKKLTLVHPDSYDLKEILKIGNSVYFCLL